MANPFAEELDRFGPDAPFDAPVSLAAAEQYCQNLATTHYENFPLVSWLLPRDLHQHFYNVFAGLASIVVALQVPILG